MCIFKTGIYKTKNIYELLTMYNFCFYWFISENTILCIWHSQKKHGELLRMIIVVTYQVILFVDFVTSYLLYTNVYILSTVTTANGNSCFWILFFLDQLSSFTNHTTKIVFSIRDKTSLIYIYIWYRILSRVIPFPISEKLAW